MRPAYKKGREDEQDGICSQLYGIVDICRFFERTVNNQGLISKYETATDLRNNILHRHHHRW